MLSKSSYSLSIATTYSMCSVAATYLLSYGRISTMKATMYALGFWLPSLSPMIIWYVLAVEKWRNGVYTISIGRLLEDGLNWELWERAWKREICKLGEEWYEESMEVLLID